MKLRTPGTTNKNIETFAILKLKLSVLHSLEKPVTAFYQVRIRT